MPAIFLPEDIRVENRFDETFINVEEIVNNHITILNLEYTRQDILNAIRNEIEAKGLVGMIQSDYTKYLMKDTVAHAFNELISRGIIVKGNLYNPYNNNFTITQSEIKTPSIKNRVLNNWDHMYMDMTKRVSLESKCAAKKVGCLLVKDNNILAVGINGTFPKATNCCDKFKKIDDIWHRAKKNMYNRIEWEKCDDQEEHYKWSLINEVHAEMNAIAKAHKNGVSVEGATAYVTHSPCFNCAKELYTHGVKRIVFLDSYDDIAQVKELLSNFEVELISYNDDQNLLK